MVSPSRSYLDGSFFILISQKRKKEKKKKKIGWGNGERMTKKKKSY